MEEKRKSNKGLIGLIVILFITVLGLGGYILVDKDVVTLKESKKKVEEKSNAKSEESSDIVLDLNGSEVKSIYHDIFLATESIDEGAKSAGYMAYDGLLITNRLFENFDLSTATEAQKLALISTYIKNKNYEYDALYTHTAINKNAYSAEMFSKIANEYFGNLTTFEHSGESDVDNCPYYTHNAEFNVYYIKGTCDHTSCGEYVKITSATEQNNKILIEFTLKYGEAVCGTGVNNDIAYNYTATVEKVNDHYVLTKANKSV